MGLTQSDREKLVLQFFEAELSPAEIEKHAENALDQAYWRALNPDLSVGTDAAGANTAEIGDRAAEELSSQFRREGYFQTGQLLDPALVARMRASIERLRSEGWPAVFSFVYDEFWQIVRTPSFMRLISGILGDGYRQNSLIWTFYVPPVKGARGWEPHADGGLGESRVTTWVPFTDATIDNGCMYVIPCDRLQDDLRVQYADLHNVTNAQLTRLLHNTRALPTPAGAYVGWNHELIHWGSVSTGRGEPRISIAVEFVARDYAARPDELPLLDARMVPSFPERIRAVAKALLTYPRYEPSLKRYAGLGRRLFESA